MADASLPQKPKAYFAHELEPGCLVYRALDVAEIMYEHRHRVKKPRRLTRYCGPCDKWVPASQTVCKACGADTEKAAR